MNRKVLSLLFVVLVLSGLVLPILLLSVHAVDFDYSLSNNGPWTLERGSNNPCNRPDTNCTITLTLIAGVTQGVTLSCVSPPAGITCNSFNPNPATPTTTSHLDIFVSGSKPEGDYALTIHGSPITTSSADTIVTIHVIAHRMFLSDTDATTTVGDGNPFTSHTTTTTITLNMNPFTTPVSTSHLASCSGLPSGIACSSFSLGYNNANGQYQPGYLPESSSPYLTFGMLTLTISVQDDKPIGDYTFTVSAVCSGGGCTSLTSTTVTVHVVAPACYAPCGLLDGIGILILVGALYLLWTSLTGDAIEGKQRSPFAPCRVCLNDER